MTDEVPAPGSLRIHADTLDYTRNGLETSEPIPLTVGTHNKIVIVRPQRRAPAVVGARGFPHDSAYPLLATLWQVWAIAKVRTPFTHHETSAGRQAMYQVYGHTSASGDEAYNKDLSDRRAAVGLALLRSDAEALRAVADEDGWGTREYQSMLRTLACDPGPTDDEPGDHTDAAAAVFRERYAKGVYHRRHAGEPAYSVESVDGLDATTIDALFDAYVHAHGAALPDDALHPVHPASGCSEFNALAPDAGADDRRLTIIGHPEPPEHQKAPCTKGDASACAVVDDQPQRCMYYREHVTEVRPTGVRFVDPRWLWLGEDRYLLSALTDLAGEAAVVFDVFDASDRARGSEPIDAPWVETPRAQSLEGVIWRGVAQVVWRSGSPPTDEDGRPDFQGHPVFRVRDPASGAFSFAPYPAKATLRVLIGSAGESEFSYRLYAGDGSYEYEAKLSEAEPVAGTHVAVSFPGVSLDTRVSLYVGPAGTTGLKVLDGVLAEGLPGNCTRGDTCKEIPVPVAPDDPEIPEEIDDDEDVSRPFLDLDPEEYVEHGFG